MISKRTCNYRVTAQHNTKEHPKYPDLAVIMASFVILLFITFFNYTEESKFVMCIDITLQSFTFFLLTIW